MVRSRFSRIAQTLAFLGALVALVGVVSSSYMLQAGRRLRTEQTATAQAAANGTATAGPAQTGTVAAGRTATQAVEQTLSRERWSTYAAGLLQTELAQTPAGYRAPTRAAPTATPLPQPPPWPSLPPSEAWGVELPVLQPQRPPALPRCTRVLEIPAPADRDVALYLYDCHEDDPQDRRALNAGSRDDSFAREEVDLDGDGRAEMLFRFQVDSWRTAVAVLGRVEGGWQERIILRSDWGHYCTHARARVEAGLVVAEMLTCGGGSGYRSIGYRQAWIRCLPTGCTLIWWADVPLAEISAGRYDLQHDLVLPVITRHDAAAVVLTTYAAEVHAYARNAAEEEAAYCRTAPSSCSSRRIRGPVTTATYLWDGQAYALAEISVEAPAMVTWRDGAAETDEVTALVDGMLRRAHTLPDGALDEAAFQAAWTSLWGLPLPGSSEYISWGPWDRPPEAAAHDGPPGQLGAQFAGVVGARDSSACLLSVYHRSGEELALVGRAAEPCSADLSRLAWADVTGDGQEELLWLTRPQGDNFYTPRQQLRIYTVGASLAPLAVLDGALNGPDGAGVLWEDRDGDGVVELLAGLSLFPEMASGHLDPTWPHWPETGRRFQVYRWDAAQGTLVPGEIVTVPWP